MNPDMLEGLDGNSMITLYTNKASPIGDQSIKDTTLIISGAPPEFKDLRRAEKWYQKQAERVATILFTTLPQGTLDRILIALMQRKVSLYKGLTDS